MMLGEGKPIFLSVVIPAYNEEERIANILQEIGVYPQE
jgi:glycosyltransferase involved in cell wall biosynthesis